MVPRAVTSGRLAAYLHTLAAARRAGRSKITSVELAEPLGLIPSVVRRDLMDCRIDAGRRGHGYSTGELMNQIRPFVTNPLSGSGATLLVAARVAAPGANGGGLLIGEAREIIVGIDAEIARLARDGESAPWPFRVTIEAAEDLLRVYLVRARSRPEAEALALAAFNGIVTVTAHVCDHDDFDHDDFDGEVSI